MTAVLHDTFYRHVKSMGSVGGESHVLGLCSKHFCRLLSDAEYLFRHSHGKLVTASARVATIAFYCLSNGFCYGRGLGVGGGGVIKVYYASGVYFSHLFCSNITFLNGMRSFSSMAVISSVGAVTAME